MAEMKVLSKLKPEPGIWATTAPVPIIGHQDVLIKIKKTAICGTDLHIYNWDEWSQKTIPIPMHVGHEFVGEIVEVGADVKHLQVGDRVSGEGHILCGHCRNCRRGRGHLCIDTIGVGVTREGAFAEYLSIPARNTFKVPDDISDDMASIFDPMGNAVHTALSFDLVGEDVLITGAGSIGLMSAAIAKHAGARHVIITDINPYKLELAKSLGIDHAINVSDCSSVEDTTTKIKDLMSDMGMKEGFDVGLEMSGNPQAMNTMFNTMNHGGKVALLGIPSRPFEVDWNTIIFHGLFLKGIYGREIFETWYKMASMLQSGLDLTKVITHHFEVDDFQKGFDLMRSGQCGKVILNWNS